MENQNIITKEGLAELKAEIKHLIEVERPKVIEEIAEARAQGDLSENAEFDAAREKQGQVEDRIKEIEAILANSKVLNSRVKSKKVRIGSEVTIQSLKDKEKETYQIVGSLEANPFENKISNISPVATAILDKEEGDVVTIDVSSKYDVKIIKVKNS